MPTPPRRLARAPRPTPAELAAQILAGERRDPDFARLVEAELLRQRGGRRRKADPVIAYITESQRPALDVLRRIVDGLEGGGKVNISVARTPRPRRVVGPSVARQKMVAPSD